MLKLVSCKSSESFTLNEDESLEVVVWFRFLLLPYFFFFVEFNITSGETSLEQLPSVEDSLYISFYFSNAVLK